MLFVRELKRRKERREKEARKAAAAAVAPSSAKAKDTVNEDDLNPNVSDLSDWPSYGKIDAT